MPEVTHKIVKNLITLPCEGKFHKELNLVSWNDREPVYDLRGWNEDHSQMTKGVTLTEKELIELKGGLLQWESH